MGVLISICYSDNLEVCYDSTGNFFDEVLNDDSNKEGFHLYKCLTQLEIDIIRPDYEGETEELKIQTRSPNQLLIVFKKIRQYLKENKNLHPVYTDVNNGSLFTQYHHEIDELISFCKIASENKKEVFWSFCI